MSDIGCAANTDREIYKTGNGEVYSDSIHVTQGGGICFNVGGYVVVKPLREWFALANVCQRPTTPRWWQGYNFCDKCGARSDASCASRRVQSLNPERKASPAPADDEAGKLADRLNRMADEFVKCAFKGMLPAEHLTKNYVPIIRELLDHAVMAARALPPQPTGDLPNPAPGTRHPHQSRSGDECSEELLEAGDALDALSADLKRVQNELDDYHASATKWEDRAVSLAMTVDGLEAQQRKAEARVAVLETFLSEIAGMGPADEEWDADTLEDAVTLAKRALSPTEAGER